MAKLLLICNLVVLGCCIKFGDFVRKFRNEYAAAAITVASLYYLQ
jgi:hypothetical protein